MKNRLRYGFFKLLSMFTRYTQTLRLTSEMDTGFIVIKYQSQICCVEEAFLVPTIVVSIVTIHVTKNPNVFNYIEKTILFVCSLFVVKD